MFDQSERYFDQDDDKPDLPKEWITKKSRFFTPSNVRNSVGEQLEDSILYYRDFTIEVQ